MSWLIVAIILLFLLLLDYKWGDKVSKTTSRKKSVSNDKATSRYLQPERSCLMTISPSWNERNITFTFYFTSCAMIKWGNDFFFT